MTKHAWSRQNEMQEAGDTPPTNEQVYSILKTIENPRDRAFLTMMYLTAGRLMEVIPIKRGDLHIESNDGEKYLLIHMKNLKNKKKKSKDQPISYFKEEKFIQLMKDHVESIGKDSALFNIVPMTGWEICIKHFEFNPHYMRHTRLTNLVLVYNFDPYRLQLFAGWSDSRPAKHYVELNWRNVAKEFTKK